MSSGRFHLIGRALSHYSIISSIGAGGMGEVYRATDTKLGRDVALKVLPAEMARDPERLTRFQREARAIAALNHPHIVTIFSVEEADGFHFLTMELVEGRSLDRHIPVGGLPIEQIVEIAGALAAALTAAHEKEIVHRDLKPANVMVTNEGRVKVLDFGLAKDLRAHSSSDITMTSAGQTQVGIVMGTPAYMSPEQISGRPLDHRTDIFSLGVLLHEMSTGRRPFIGESSAELASAILRDSPPPVNEVRPELPADLARIIRRCMEKDVRQRVQTARDVSNEFRDLARRVSSWQSAPRSSTAASSTPRSSALPDSASARADEGFWLAVLPLKYGGSNLDVSALADGMTEEIITGLSRFPYLKVIAQSSTSRYAHEKVDVRLAAKELGARYVLEGNLRQAGARLRIGVQLVEADSGAHIWAETFERTLQPEAIFELQDELVPRIVSTIADPRGVLPQNISESLRGKDPLALSPYEATMRSFAYFQRIDAGEHLAAREALERAVRQAPGYATAWAMLAIVVKEEYAHGFNQKPDPLGRAFAAARRGIEASPSNHLAYNALASVLFFRHELQAFYSAAQQAVALNPMDGFTVAYMGFLTAYAGDWERGCELAERARSFNPLHPGWYWVPSLVNAYRKHDYRGALELALKVNMPGFWRTNMMLAATYAQLGESEAAHKALQALLRGRPEFIKTAREDCERWWQPELVEHLLDGLRKAGMEISFQKQATATELDASHSPAKVDSGATRAGEGFWVAVLPFKSSGASPELAALADGMSEEIIAGLSRFSYLRVITRSTTMRYANQAADQQTVKNELGARYVMEGSLRQSGPKLRIAVQLVDATSGAHLWAQTYDRAFVAEEIFALQDDLVPCIVSTIADQYGVLPRSMNESVRNKDEALISPHEAVLRAFSYFERLTSEEHARAKRTLERAVLQAPDEADCWAMLSMMFRGEYVYGFNAEPDSLPRALAAARRAVEMAPTNHLAYFALAATLFFQRDRLAFRVAAKRCIELNPMDGSTAAYLGFLLAASGEWDYGTSLVESALRLNPNYPNWYNLGIFMNAYHKGKYKDALDAALGINLPGSFHSHAARAAALGQLGYAADAKKSLGELLAVRPDFATAVRDEYGKFYEPEVVEHLVDGLRKAGLPVASDAQMPSPPPATPSGDTNSDP